MRLTLGKWTEEDLETLLRAAAKIRKLTDRISFISEQFLKIPYKGFTLVGKEDIAEELVVNLAAVDCFTFIDYVEAMRRSASYDDFISNLRLVRYRGGDVSFSCRNHFFTDWREYSGEFIQDVTEEIGGRHARKSFKKLNLREDGTFFLPGLGIVSRDIFFIASDAVDAAMLNRLVSGDYLGIYAPLEGLDVTHIGIVIKQGKTCMLRHASSSHHERRVVDSPLAAYLAGVPGFMVLRPQEGKKRVRGKKRGPAAGR